MDWQVKALSILGYVVVGLGTIALIYYLITGVLSNSSEDKNTKAENEDRLKPIPRKKFTLDTGIIPLDILFAILIVVVVLLPTNVLRPILALPILLFSPGYILLSAIFVKKASMDRITRVILSFALSIVIVPLIALVLNYTPWGIKVESVLYSIASLNIIISIISLLRRSRVNPDERFSVRYQVRMPGLGENYRQRVITVILLFAILGALGTLGYVTTISKAKEAFTNFYILGFEHKAEKYPKDLKPGDKGVVIVGIVNHERKEISYRVEVFIAGQKSNEIGPIMLVDGQTWEDTITLTPEIIGTNLKVEFLLYENGKTNFHLEPLVLWINVVK
jgi:uncharacterized membrane protein